jgi:hypothetical protein
MKARKYIRLDLSKQEVHKLLEPLLPQDNLRLCSAVASYDGSVKFDFEIMDENHKHEKDTP